VAQQQAADVLGSTVRQSRAARDSELAAARRDAHEGRAEELMRARREWDARKASELASVRQIGESTLTAAIANRDLDDGRKAVEATQVLEMALEMRMMTS
jgi:hypothetical protein